MNRNPSVLLVACALTAFAAAGQTVNYTYDQAGRLTGVSYPGGASATYTYDASGNLLRKVIAGAPAITVPPPAPANGGVVNAASEQNTSVAPGEMVAIYGSGIGPSSLANFSITSAGFFDTIAGNTSVYFDGIPAPLIFAQAGITAAIVPYSVAGQATTQMTVTYQGVTSPPLKLNVVSAAPGLFSHDGSGTGQGAILNQDNSVNSSSNPAARGSIIVLYGTGEGQTTPTGVDGRIANTVFPKPVLPVNVTIGGIDATSGILYAGAAPTLVAGVFQIDVTVPANAPTGNVPVVVTVGSAPSQSNLTVALQ